MNYFTRISLAISQMINAVLLFGNHGESISGRAHRQAMTKHSKSWIYLERLINIFAFWSSNHCKRAYRHDVQVSQGFLDRYKQFYDIMALQLIHDIEDTVKGLSEAVEKLDNEELKNDLRQRTNSQRD